PANGPSSDPSYLRATRACLPRSLGIRYRTPYFCCRTWRQHRVLLMGALAAGSLVLTALILLSTPAFAQPAIAGIVKDASGAILPGVNVEAASPALIEKSRTVVTDNTGQYRIVDLKPGTYVVTFTLSGFSTVKR